MGTATRARLSSVIFLRRDRGREEARGGERERKGELCAERQRAQIDCLRAGNRSSRAHVADDRASHRRRRRRQRFSLYFGVLEDDDVTLGR